MLSILKRRRYGPTFPSPDQAAEWVDAVRRDVPGVAGAGGPMTLADGLRAVLRDLTETGGRQGTSDYYSRAFVYLARSFGAATPLCDIDAASIRHFLDRRRRAGIADATIVRKELGTLRRIMRLALAEKAIARDPFLDVRLPRLRTGRYECMTAAQVEDAIGRVRGAQTVQAAHHADVLEVFWRTGARRAEVVRMRAADVDLNGRRIFVEGKTGNRYVPIAVALVEPMKRLLAQARTDGRLVDGVRMVEHLFERWRKRLALPAFSAHVLRHSFATDLLSRGVPPHEVASLLGHSGIRMLERYFHAQDGRLRAAVDALGGGRESRATRDRDGAVPGRPGGATGRRSRRRSERRLARRSGTDAETLPRTPRSSDARS